MRRLAWLLTRGVLAAMVVAPWFPAMARGAPPEAAAEEARPSPSPERPIYLFLNTPADLESLWKTLDQPDFVLLKGPAASKQPGPGPASPSPAGPWAAVVRSVAVRGEVAGGVASLNVDYTITLAAPGPLWAPLRLDDRRAVTDAREGDRLLPLRVAADEGWQVELRGEGEHRVRVELRVPVGSTSAARSLALSIPEAPSTQLEVDVDEAVSEASLGGDEVVSLAAIRGGKGTRLSAHLSPRSRVELTWRVKAEVVAEPPPLLSVRGEVAIDVDPGAFRTRSTWAVRSIRGSIDRLDLQLDPEDEVLELTLDGQPVPTGTGRDAGVPRLSIPLGEPLRSGSTRRLVMTTQRKLPAQKSARLTFRGFPLGHAREQSGAIGIAQSGNLVVSPAAGRGLRQIDPRTELPADLRARPSTFLAYQFVDQPFELELLIEPSPPLVRFEGRTTITLEAGQAKLDTRLAAETASGRLLDVSVVVPRGLELESVGPPDVVESWQVSPQSDGARLMTARLTFRALEGNAFAIHLTGRQAIDPARPVRLALFQPRESSLGGGHVAVLAERNLTVDLPEAGGGAADPEVFRPARQEPPADWPWPAANTLEETPALWLRYDGSPAALPLRVVVHPRSVSHETSLVVQLGRKGLEGRQETDLEVHFGTLDQVDVEVPRELLGRWEVEDGDVAGRTDLGPGPSGGRLFRLTLNDPVTDRTRLTFRLRLPPPADLRADRETAIEVPWLRFPRGASTPPRVRVVPEPGVRVDVASAGWVRGAGDEGASPAGGPSAQLRLVALKAESETPALRLSATAMAPSPLPPLLASRLWLRTVQNVGGDLATSAWYWVEAHESSLALSLPGPARLLGARVAGDANPRVEPLPHAAGYRIHFPARAGSGPFLVAVDYRVPARNASAAWEPPRLLEGVVLQTRWEVRLPSNREVVGVPPGWTDENHWYWDTYAWKRRPWRSSAELASWSGGPGALSRGALTWDDGRGDSRRYLFERMGDPSELRLLVSSRGSLVALCSGPVLGLGVLMVLYRRPAFRLAWVALLGLLLAVAAAFQPSLTLQLAQSAAVGVAFTALAAALQRAVERPRGRAAAIFGEAGNLGVAPAGGSSVAPAAGAGSDDSTAIRVRTSSTVDHVANTAAAAAESASRRGSSRELRG